MNYSLNEVEATAKRATRGAGYTWGLAEEAAKATRWLCAHGVDGAVELSRVLERGFAAAPKDHVPTVSENDWAGGQELCPLMAGALLSDSSHRLKYAPICITQIASPMMLLPFAAYAARSQKAVVKIVSGNFLAATDGTRLALRNECPAFAGCIEVTLGGVLTEPRTLLTRATPDPTAWKSLNRFAYRTYAPATEESRLLGAGAGLSDND